METIENITDKFQIIINSECHFNQVIKLLKELGFKFNFKYKLYVDTYIQSLQMNLNGPFRVSRLSTRYLNSGIEKNNIPLFGPIITINDLYTFKLKNKLKIN